MPVCIDPLKVLISWDLTLTLRERYVWLTFTNLRIYQWDQGLLTKDFHHLHLLQDEWMFNKTMPFQIHMGFYRFLLEFYELLCEWRIDVSGHISAQLCKSNDAWEVRCSYSRGARGGAVGAIALSQSRDRSKTFLLRLWINKRVILTRNGRRNEVRSGLVSSLSLLWHWQHDNMSILSEWKPAASYFNLELYVNHRCDVLTTNYRFGTSVGWRNLLLITVNLFNVILFAGRI